MGRRRSAGDLLLRRRAGTQARVRRRRPPRPGARRAADRRRNRRDGRPAAVYIAINLAAGHPDYLDGWAVPIATDIAFALAVLAVLSTHLPSALRTFLLTLAVVDDLLAITVIAVFFTDHLSLGPLALALIPIGLFGGGGAARRASLVVAGPAGRGGLALVHASGYTPPSRACYSASPCPCSAGTAGPPPNTSNTPCGRCRRASRCLCSPSSPPV